MTPINEGLYEFKKESLVELRRLMGLPQNKMAELLGVPANTLSRWETGATVPDAASLAAVYSLAKDHGVETPAFFGIRRSPLEVKLGSGTRDDTGDPLSIYRLMRVYLNTEIRVTDIETRPVVRVMISNSAPVAQEWPKVVFTGVGLSLGHYDRNTVVVRRSSLQMKITLNKEDKTSKIGDTPWQYDEKRQTLLKTEYTSISAHVVSGHGPFPDITPDEGAHGAVLFPGQSMTCEFNVPPEELPYIRLKVDGTVSRRHLFHCEEAFEMPESITRQLVINAFAEFKAIDIHGPLESTMNALPDFNRDTLLEDAQTLFKSLFVGINEIKTAQGALNMVFRDCKFSWFRAHLRATHIHLERVSTAFVHMKEAVESNVPDRITSEVANIRALKAEAALLDKETGDLMCAHNISNSDVKGFIRK